MRITDHLDTITAGAGLVVLGLLIPYLVINDFHPIYLVTAGVGIGGVILYLAWSHYGAAIPSNQTGRAWSPIVIALLFCLLAWAVFLFRSEQYVKPMTYYILIACATGSAFYGSLRSTNRFQVWVILGIACTVGLSHIWTENLLFPNSLIGVDPWAHQARVLEQPGLSDLPRLGGSLSLMHLYLSPVINLLGIDYKWASLALVGTPLTLGTILLTFLLGRTLWSTKVGCVAALVVASANWVIFFGEWIIPNSLGVVYSLAVAYLIVRMNRGSTKLLLLPVILLVLIAYATHFIATLWVLGTLACLWVLPPLFDSALSAKDKVKKIEQRLIVPMLGVLAVVLLLKFTILGSALKETTGSNVFAPAYGMTYAIGKAPVPDELIGQAGQAPVSVFEQKDNILGELAIDSSGMLLYIGLAITGCLMMLRRAAKPMQKTFVLLGITVLSIGFFPSLFGLSVIEHRWWYFAEVLLAVPLGISLASLASSWRHSAVPVTVLVMLVSFLSAIGLASNMTNRTLSPNLIVRYAFTNGEIEAINAIQAQDSLIVGTDPLFRPLVAANVHSPATVVPLTNEIMSGDFRNSRADVLLLRSALNNEPFGFGSGAIYRLDYDIVSLAEGQGYSKLGENKEVTWLVRQQ